MPFHRRCGERVALLNNNLTALRHHIEYKDGVVISSEPLVDDVVFEVRIDKMVNSWSGSIEIGVTAQDPETMDHSSISTPLNNDSWLLDFARFVLPNHHGSTTGTGRARSPEWTQRLHQNEYSDPKCTDFKIVWSGTMVTRDGIPIQTNYGTGLNVISAGDNIGVMRTSKGELKFFVNGVCLGVAARDLPSLLYAVVNLYGRCAQVTINDPVVMRAPFPLPSAPVLLLIDTDTETTAEQMPDQVTNDDNTTVSEEVKTVTGTEYKQGSKGPDEEVRLDLAVEPVNDHISNQDQLRFHSRCGILVTLSNHNRTAERARPLDDYNNGVVMTHRPLTNEELFEIRIERLIDKWSGSIEVGITTHNPATLRFPNTMTNMESGTIMMSGCKILVNGHATGAEYGYSNLDELKEGDTVGMMRTSNSQLHYFINGVDQGVAFEDIEEQVWGVVDLYGMTVKVTICEGATEIDQHQSGALAENNVDRTLASQIRPRIDEDTLLFHTLRNSTVVVVNDGKTAHRPNAHEYFHNGVVTTNRTLKTNELFQVRLDSVIPKWAGSIEIGVTQHLCNEITFPFKMSNAKSGTWAMTGEDVIRDGSVIIPQYVRDLTKLVEGDTVGVMRKEMGILHFFVNGVDQGMAAFNVPEHVFGVVDLYGKVGQVTIVDSYVPPTLTSPESQVSSESNGTIYPELCFHRVHGHNVVLKRSRLTAKRRNNSSEFSNAVLFSSRPLRECEMFELRVEQVVNCWVGGLEIGVTAIKPEELESAAVEEQPPSLTGTAGDLSWNTYILSGSSIFKDGELVHSNYALDVDKLTVGSRVGLMWHSDRSLHYYLDGLDQGRAFDVPHLNIYAVVDVYGQCAQVSIMQTEDRGTNYACTSDNSTVATNPKTFSETPKPYCFSEYCGETMWMSQDYRVAVRRSMEPTGGLVFSSGHLRLGEPFQVNIVRCKSPYYGSLRIGLTDIDILNAHVNRSLPSNITLLPNFITYIDGDKLMRSTPGEKDHVCIRKVRPSFADLTAGDTVALLKINTNTVQVYLNSCELDVFFENVPDKVFVAAELYGRCTVVKAVTKAPSTAKIIEQPIYQCPITPLTEEPEPGPSHQQDPQPSTSAAVEPALSPLPNQPKPFTFHPVCGSNLRLVSSDTVAVREYSYNHGIAVVGYPMRKGKSCHFRLDTFNLDWIGTLMIGIITELPNEDLPESAVHLNTKGWIIDHEVMNYNGNLIPTDIARALLSAEEGTVLSLHFTQTHNIDLHIDDVFCCTIATPTSDVTELYPIIDMYGQCTQVSLLMYPYKIEHSMSIILPPSYLLEMFQYLHDVGFGDDSKANDEDEIINEEAEDLKYDEDAGDEDEEDETNDEDIAIEGIDDDLIIAEDTDNYSDDEIGANELVIAPPESMNDLESLAALVAIDMAADFDENIGHEPVEVLMLSSFTDNRSDDDEDVDQPPVDEGNDLNDQQDDDIEIYDEVCGGIFDRLVVARIPIETDDIVMATSDEFADESHEPNINFEEDVDNDSTFNETAGDMFSEREETPPADYDQIYDGVPTEYTHDPTEFGDEMVYELPDEFAEDYVDENDFEIADDIVNKVARDLDMHTSDMVADETSDSIVDEIVDEVADEVPGDLVDEISDVIADEVADELIEEVINLLFEEDTYNPGYVFANEEGNEADSDVTEGSEERDDSADDSDHAADGQNEQTTDDQNEVIETLNAQSANGQSEQAIDNDDEQINDQLEQVADINEQRTNYLNEYAAYSHNDQRYNNQSEQAHESHDEQRGDDQIADLINHFSDIGAEGQSREVCDDDQNRDHDKRPIEERPDKLLSERSKEAANNLNDDNEEDTGKVAKGQDLDKVVKKLTKGFEAFSTEIIEASKKEEGIGSEEEGDKVGVDIDDEDSEADNLVFTGLMNSPSADDWMQEEAGALIRPRPGPSTSNDEQHLFQVLTQSVLGAQHRRTSGTPNDIYNRELQRSKSNNSFCLEKELPCNDRSAPWRPFDVTQQPIVLRETAQGFQDVTAIVHRDPNVRHNALYPEQNAGDDSLDSEDIINALSNMESNNWPDLNDERSSSGYEATNASESFGHQDMEAAHYVNSNFGYLKNLIFCDDEPQNRMEYDGDENRDGVAKCEYLHTVLKYWRDLVPHFPENRQSVMWGHIECHCQHCDPTAPPCMAGWVRIRRDLPPPNPKRKSERVYWNIDGSLIRWVLLSDAATLMHASTGRPSCLQIIPSSAPYFSTLWFDEERKPLRASIAIEIDKNYDESGAEVEPKDDRMIALLLRLEPPVPNLEEDVSTMLPDDDFDDFE